jgi:tetratricopeptide (TPR) repeat protein
LLNFRAQASAADSFVKALPGPSAAAVIEWYDSGSIQDHWSHVRELVADNRTVDPSIVFRILDCAQFLNDRRVLLKGLRFLSRTAVSGVPMFEYTKKNLGMRQINRLFRLYRAHFDRNPGVARYVASLIGVSGLRSECCDYLVALRSAAPDDKVIARGAIKALTQAGRESEALPILDHLRSTGKLEKAGWTLLDRILVSSGNIEKANEIFAQGAVHHGSELRFITDAIQCRDKALAVAEADRIEQIYLNQLPVTAEIAELRMKRYMRLQRFNEALALSIACSKAGIGNAAITVLERRCQLELFRSLMRAGRKEQEEALPLLEHLRCAGRLEKSGWMLHDWIFASLGQLEKAREIFEQGHALYPGDFGFIANAIRARDSALELTDADRIQRQYLDPLPINAEITELKMRRCMRVDRYQEAIDIAADCARQGIASQTLAALATKCHLEMGLPGQVTPFLEKMESRCGAALREGWPVIEHLVGTGRHAEARQHISQLEHNGKTDLVPPRVFENWKSEIKVFEDTSAILSRFPASNEPRGVVVLFSQGGSLSHIWMGLTAAELKKSGFAVVFPYVYGQCEVERTGDPDIDSLHGLLDFSMKRLTDEPEGIPPRRFEWTIDPDRGIVAACGINFFQPICARIGTILRRYRFSFDHPIAKATLESHVAQADAMLAFCERIKNSLGRRHIPVRFLSGMTHYVPAAVLRQYCDAYGDEHHMNYVAFVAGYEHYYTNLKNDRTGALSLRNLTKNKALNGPSRVHAYEFESWAERLSEAEKTRIQSEIMSIVRFDRARKIESAEAMSVLERVRSHRRAGGNVVCLFGKILYDIWMDELEGVVHADIVDWVNHSIEAVAGSNTLLLIKPHPNETNSLIASPTEFFFDLIEREINDNVIVCDHKWFNVGDLLQYLDLGLLWTGTAALELQAAGVPVAMCSKWGVQDHPVPFVDVRDRSRYEAMLRDPGHQRLPQEVRERCLLLLKYYSTPEVMIPYAYGNMRYLRGKDIGPPRWYMDKVEEYFKHGDPHVQRMAQKCL